MGEQIPWREFKLSPLEAPGSEQSGCSLESSEEFQTVRPPGAVLEQGLELQKIPVAAVWEPHPRTKEIQTSRLFVLGAKGKTRWTGSWPSTVYFSKQLQFLIMSTC